MTSAAHYFRQVGELMASIEATAADGSSIPLDDATERVVASVIDTGAAMKKIVLIGNGGSASIAGHMEMDLCNRVGVRATVFNDPPVLTALANDHGYASAFERMVALWVERGDCLIAISSSGASENILRAVREARRHQCTIFTFSGFAPDNPLRTLGDVNFYVASREYGEVEVAHHGLGHFLTDCAATLRGSGEQR